MIPGGSVSERLSRRTETFIVRLWAEYLVQTPPMWRGEIQRVGGGEVMRFVDLDQLSECIRLCVSGRYQSQEQEEKDSE